MRKEMHITGNRIDCLIYQHNSRKATVEGEERILGYTINGNNELCITIGNVEETMVFKAKDILALLISFEQLGSVWEDILNEIEGGKNE